MRQRDSLSWGRIATITGLSSSSIRWICTWDLEDIMSSAFREGLAAYHGLGYSHGGCRLLRSQTPRTTMFTRLVRDPNHELADDCTPAPIQ